jgi:DNA-binding MarR family transcriptional regulator
MFPGLTAGREKQSFYRSTIHYKNERLHRDQIGSMKKLTSSDYQALAEFRFHIRKFLHRSEQAVQQAGLERGQYQLMLAIKGMPAGVRPRVAELASRMQIQHHSAVELGNRLQAGGLVRRERAQQDRREVLLALTAKGERVLAELALHHHEQLRSAGPVLVAALRRVMHGENETAEKHRRSPREKRKSIHQE